MSRETLTNWYRGILQLGPVPAGEKVTIDVDIAEPDPDLTQAWLVIRGTEDNSIEDWNEHGTMVIAMALIQVGLIVLIVLGFVSAA